MHWHRACALPRAASISTARNDFIRIIFHQVRVDYGGDASSDGVHGWVDRRAILRLLLDTGAATHV